MIQIYQGCLFTYNFLSFFLSISLKQNVIPALAKALSIWVFFVCGRVNTNEQKMWKLKKIYTPAHHE